jgi:hypothetical protein
MHLHAIPPHKVQKSPPLNVQSYTLTHAAEANGCIAHCCNQMVK